MGFERIMFGSLGIILILCIVIVGYVYVTIVPPTLTIIDIQSNLEPVEPYDIAKLESVLEMNNNHWIIVAKYIDVDTNTTIYDELIYNLESKTFSNR